MIWRDQLGSSYSHLQERLSLNLGDSTGKVAGDTASAKRDNSAGCVPDLVVPSQALICCSKSSCITWVCLPATGFSSFPSFLPSNSIHKYRETLTPHEVRLFRKKTDLFKEYSFSSP